ncbi:MAG: 30S ribosomal protein S16 [Patescibacteria group bacterium]
MLAIKFRRIGKKDQPSYRIVVSEKKSKVFGKFIEDLGWYDPKSKKFNINKERAQYRLKTGCQPTDTVHNFLVKTGVIKGPKRPVHSISKKQEEVKSQETAQPTA